MARHLLTDNEVKNAKATGKPYRLHDGDGLALAVSILGGKSWQYRYKIAGRSQTLTIGKYPTFTLKDARDKADAARRDAGEGEHLTALKRVRKARKAAMAADTFAKVAANWLKDEGRRKGWSSEYSDDVESSLTNHLSTLDNLPIGAISAPICAPILRRLEAAKPDTASKVRQRLRGILDHAVEHGLIPFNPIPTGRRISKKNAKHFPAIVDPNGVGEVLRAAERAECCRGVRRAHILTVFTAQRISEVVGAQWNEFDLTAGIWAIPRERMKMRDSARGPHEVPIPDRLLAKLTEWKRDGGDYVCPAPRGDGFITREAMEKFYRRTLGLAGRHSPHSWRSVLKTFASNAGKDTEVVEAQLDHVIGSKVASAYDRANRLALRRELMLWYEGELLAVAAAR